MTRDELTAMVTDILKQDAKTYLDPATLQVFLIGYLSDKHAIQCDTATFDSAADEFLTKTGLTNHVWVDVLLEFCNSISSDKNSFASYMRDQLQACVSAPVEPAKPSMVKIDVSIAEETFVDSQHFCQTVRKIPGLESGHVFKILFNSVVIEEPTVGLCISLVLVDSGPAILFELMSKGRIRDSKVTKSLLECVTLRVSDILSVEVNVHSHGVNE